MNLDRAWFQKNRRRRVGLRSGVRMMRALLKLVLHAFGLSSGGAKQTDLVRVDAMALQTMHKHLAEAIARKRETLGAHGLYDGRQPSHWRHVADWIADHPLPRTGNEIRIG